MGLIPSRIHHIWLGPRPMPEAWPERWRQLHPGWECRVWREADLARLKMRNGKLYEQLLGAGQYVGAADVARLEILWAEGGVYVDIDSAPLRTLEGAYFMEAELFAAYEPIQTALPGRVANGTIGAIPKQEAIDTARQLIGRMRVTDPPWATIGAPALTAALLVHERCCRIQLLPSRVFYRKDARGRPVGGKEESFVEHFWSSTNEGYPPEVVVLVPRRAGDPIRDRIWDWCRRIWEQQGWRIVEGHYDEPGLFSASIARNRAAAAAGSWDVAIFADADTIPYDWSPVREAVGIAASTHRFVRPFSTYHFLDDEGSRSFMETGVLPRSTRRLQESAYGGIHVVSRKLWEESGGYDERFLGWGSEDAAFQFACTALRGFRRLRGDVYHLAHPMQPRDPGTPQYVANVELGQRYRQAQHSRTATLRLIAERSRVRQLERERFALLLITNGRRQHIPGTLEAARAMLRPIDDVMVCDDSGDPAMADWLREAIPGAAIDAHRHLGHGPAVARALRMASESDADWIFVLEEDMRILQPIDLQQLAAIIDQAGIAQMVLKRGPHFPAELEAGGMIERFDPGSFTEESANGTSWLRHRLFYSLNPHLVRRSWLARQRWPATGNSEHIFSSRLFRDRRISVGLWGSRESEPVVEHAGTEPRSGSGY